MLRMISPLGLSAAAAMAVAGAQPLAAQTAGDGRYTADDYAAAYERPARGYWSRAQFDATWEAVQSVPEAISVAADATTIDHEFLLAQAYLESAMDPAARARTSSATGLYQFITSTWLRTVHRHGARFGLDDWAGLLAAGPGGKVDLRDSRLRRQLLELRKDPLIASIMAAGLAEDNREALLPVLRRDPTYTELYLAHFLGAGGAQRFVALMQHSPSANAAAQFPKAARANRAIFYKRGGGARSIAGVKAVFDRKIDRALAKVGHHADVSPYHFASGQMVARTPQTTDAREDRAYLSVDDGVYESAGNAASGAR